MTEANFAAQCVITMRLMRIGAGGKIAKREARRIIVEKVAAAAEAGMLMATGGDPHTVAKHHRRAVKANEKRLHGRGR
jgi:hypothetical protein